MSDEHIEAVAISAVRFARKGEFVTRTITGETVVVPIRGQIGDLDAIYHFNEVGSFIWNLLDGKTSVHVIVQAVREEFDVALEDAERDTLEFVAALQSAGLIGPSVERIHDAYRDGGDDVLSRFQLEPAQSDASRACGRQCDD
jgi:Coenzyme PQQ synthesis protein D (PqqD)